VYYRIDTSLGLESGSVEIDPDFEVFNVLLMQGVVLDGAKVNAPIKFTVTPNPDFRLNMNAYYPEYHLFDSRLVQSMLAAGASNLQVFPAVIRNTHSGEELQTYSVVNIVGLVACANAAKSEGVPLADSTYFLRLLIDPAKVGGASVFRLQESLLDVIVNETLATAMKNGQFTNLVLESVTP
jgi:hypothetical protein